MVVLNWDAHRWQTEFEFDNLKDYFNLMEAQFEAAKENERKKLQQWPPPPGLTEEEFAIWDAEVEFFEERYENDFPSKIRYSFVVLLYITLEARLKSTCDEITRRRGLTIKESHIKGAVIERTKIFLTKVAGVPPQDREAWQWLDDIQKVRDCIIHANGYIQPSRDKKRLEELCKKEIGLSLSADYLVVRQEFYLLSLPMIQKCFFDIFQSAGFGPSTLSPFDAKGDTLKNDSRF